jgi:N-terminal domain of anti-restriction factor ArdC
VFDYSTESNTRTERDRVKFELGTAPEHRERVSFTMSTNENTAQEKQDVYARVTSQIINAIEQGVSNWRMPWHTSGKFAFSPVNVTSRKPYRGINTVCLWAAAQASPQG